MIRSYLKSTIRNVARNKGYYFLNVIGLALGLSGILLAYLYIGYDRSFDKFNTRHASIYRIVFSEDTGFKNGSTQVPMILGETLHEQSREIPYVRLNNAGGARTNFSIGDMKFQESAFFFTDPSFFTFFSFPWIEGDPANALKEPFAMVITRKMATKYFGSGSPLNEALEMEWGAEKYPIRITGVLEDLPGNSHLKFDMLISHATAEAIFNPKSFFTDWTAAFCFTYVIIPNAGQVSTAEKSLNTMMRDHLKDGLKQPVRLQPLDAIHLGSSLKSELSENSDPGNHVILVIVSLLLMIICIVNFSTLYISLFERKIKEHSRRSIFGGSRFNAVQQTLADIGLQFCAVACVSVLLIVAVSTAFNLELRQPISVILSDPFYRVVLLTIMVIIFLCVAGLPVFLTVNQRVVMQRTVRFAGSFPVINFFTTLQIVIAVVFIAFYFFASNQFRFINTVNLGFDQTNIVTIPQGRFIRARSESIKHELLKIAGVESITISSEIPGSSLDFVTGALPDRENSSQADTKVPIAIVSVDYDFLSTYKIATVEGRNFAPLYPSDSTASCLINETAVREIGWKNPLGRKIKLAYNVGDGTFESKEVTVAGVIADVHFESLHQKVKSMLMLCKPFWFYQVSIRLKDGVPQPVVLAEVGAKWNRLVPEAPFESSFLEARLQRQYTPEKVQMSVLFTVMMIALFVVVSGTLAAISFRISARKKEMAIRSFLGASFRDCVVEMTRGLVILCGVALVAAPVLASPLINLVNQSFYYKTVFPVVSVAAGIAGLVILLVAISVAKVLLALQNSLIANLRSD